METFIHMSLRDQLRKARREGVSPDVVPGNPAYDEDDVGLYVDPDGDIRDGRMDKAERAFVAAGNRAVKEVASEAAAPASPVASPDSPVSTE